MVRRNKRTLWGAALAAVFLLLCLAGCKPGTPSESGPVETPHVTEPAQPGKTDEPTIQVAKDFSCYVLDTNGQKIHGYASEETGMWYLFVPGTLDVSALTLYVSDNVETVSSGTLDTGTWTVSDAFAGNNELTLTCKSGTARVKVMQSNLPSLHIVLADTTLDTVHQDKDEKAKGNSIYLIDPTGEHSLTVEGSVELKGRGNSSWMLFDKKGYQIKFEEKTSVLGMGKAKKWVLLANASDDSMMRTQLAYQTAAQMGMAFVPSFEYIDLWINGDYRGTYIIGEKVELGGSRLDLEDPLGALFEHDEGFYQEEDYWFRSDYLERHFVLKEAVEEKDEAAVLAAMDHFSIAVDRLMEYLYSTPPHLVTLDELSRRIDVDSFVKYYLINEYTLNRESFNTSFYWYMDGPTDVIHLGPIWDFDTCMGNDGASFDETYGEGHMLFRYLLAAPEFRQRTLELKDRYMPLFAEMADNADALFDRIAASVEMNYLRWDVLGKTNPKGGEAFHVTYEEALDALKGWLLARYTAFEIPEIEVATSVVSDDCCRMELCYLPQSAHQSVRFALWSLEGGQDDLVWYEAAQRDDGLWYASVDLRLHNSAGIYQYDVYHSDSTDAAATGRNYVEMAADPVVWIDAEVSENEKEIEIRLTDSEVSYDNVRFAVWSFVNGQDDLKWYAASKGEPGIWTADVDVPGHGDEGTYHICAYSTLPTGDRKIAESAVHIGEPRLNIELLENNSRMWLSFENMPTWTSRVWFAVWSDEGGQDDLEWYRPEKNGMTWSLVVDLSEHSGAGEYHVHIYTGTDSPEELLLHTKVLVE